VLKTHKTPADQRNRSNHLLGKSVANLIDCARQTGCWVASSDVTGTSSNLMSWGCTAIVTLQGAS